MNRFFLLTAFLFCSYFLHAQHTIRVMSYNIRFDNPKDGVNEWGQRKKSVLLLLEKNEPHIVGTQEVLRNQYCYLSRKLKGYAGFGAGRENGKKKGEYAAIFYRKKVFRKLSGGHFWLSQTPEEAGRKGWDAANVRMVSWLRLQYKTTGQTVFVFNTHFDHIGKVAREQSALLLLSKIKMIAGNELFLVTGDLNTQPPEEPYRTLVRDSVCVDAAGINNNESTFCGFKVSSTQCKRIDYIFINKKMKSDSYSIIRDNNGVHYPSDHMPVMAEISF